MSKKANDFIDRMCEESNWLTEKVNKLGEFMQTENYFKIDQQQQILLLQQLNAMSEYSNILNMRITTLSMRLAEETEH